MHLAASLISGSRDADIKMFGDALGTYVVVDLLRASAVICTALANGASEIIPVADVDEARTLRDKFGDERTLLCGERGGRKLPGFDLGNSPAEYTPEAVSGRRIIHASTNGSPALTAAPADTEVMVAGLVNLSAAAAHIARIGRPTLIVCAGKVSRFALEDAVAVGALIARLWETDVELELVNDGAGAAQALWDRFKSDPGVPVWQSEHGRFLISLGFGSDLSVCTDIDSVPVVPVMRDGRLVAEASKGPAV
ncbi:MAG: 2-phosphosulfolactate phosphatase [Acidobacteria bacterium]|nr:2-phosphosulfolactate phosphatase [Acidobacteriota bacterium]